MWTQIKLLSFPGQNQLVYSYLECISTSCVAGVISMDKCNVFYYLKTTTTTTATNTTTSTAITY